MQRSVEIGTEALEGGWPGLPVLRVRRCGSGLKGHERLPWSQFHNLPRVGRCIHLHVCLCSHAVRKHCRTFQSPW